MARYHEIVDEAKAGGCVDCKNEFRPYVLQFDHVPERGPKVFVVGEARMHAIYKLRAEIAKCDVVCANCHCERGFQRRTDNEPATA